MFGDDFGHSLNQVNRLCWPTTLAVTLLMASGLSRAAETNDSRLVEAARNQDAKAVRSLLSQKADVNARSSDGSTALLWAGALERSRYGGSAAAARVRTRTQPTTFGMTPLSQACINGSAALVRLLLKSGANPNTAIATGETPLMTCAKSGNVDAVRMLIEYGAAINAKEPAQNQTALMWAAAERHPDVVKALIEAHADLKAHSKEGFTAIHFAAREGDLESVKLLLAAGVDVNILTQPDDADANRHRGLVAAWSHGVREDRPRGVTRLHSAAGRHGARPGATSRCTCWIMEPIPTSWRRALRRCIGRRPRGKASPRIRCTVLKIRCPEFRIVRPSCGW